MWKAAGDGETEGATDAGISRFLLDEPRHTGLLKYLQGIDGGQNH